MSARDYHLDYEIELGFVLLNDLARDALPTFAGWVWSSDHTDRVVLTRHVNLRDVSSGEGFTHGKSERCAAQETELGRMATARIEAEQSAPAATLAMLRKAKEAEEPRFPTGNEAREAAANFQQITAELVREQQPALPPDLFSFDRGTVKQTGTSRRALLASCLLALAVGVGTGFGWAVNIRPPRRPQFLRH